MDKFATYRYMPNQINIRQFTYVITIVMHGINALVMLSRFRGDVMENPKIQTYHAFQNRYISCWTFVMQMAHAALGLSCDVMSHESMKETNTLKALRVLRDVVFDSMVVPYSFMVPAAFWSLFLYDRNLILPICLNAIICPLSNHIMHTLVPVITVIHISLHTGTEPKSHRINLATLGGLTWIYLCVLGFSYQQRGEWPYPVLTALYGTVYFHIFIATVVASLPFFYFLRWQTIRWWNREEFCQKLE